MLESCQLLVLLDRLPLGGDLVVVILELILVELGLLGLVDVGDVDTLQTQHPLEITLTLLRAHVVAQREREPNLTNSFDLLPVLSDMYMEPMGALGFK